MITVLAGIGERPGATTLLSRSTPMSGSDRTARQDNAAAGDLGVGEVADQVVGEAAARETAQQRNAGHERRRPVEPARKHHVLDDSLIGAAEGGTLRASPRRN